MPNIFFVLKHNSYWVLIGQRCSWILIGQNFFILFLLVGRVWQVYSRASDWSESGLVQIRHSAGAAPATILNPAPCLVCTVYTLFTPLSRKNRFLTKEYTVTHTSFLPYLIQTSPAISPPPCPHQ